MVTDGHWPDPIMALQRVIGFGGSNTDHVIFTNDCKEIVFPSHSLVVAMEIGETRRQKIFIGHTDKVMFRKMIKLKLLSKLLCTLPCYVLSVL